MLSGEFKIKVYYEDTDSGGVVYYANYLKFLERARTELIFDIGLSNNKLLKNYGTLLIVKSCKIEYKKPLVLEDTVVIKSKVKSISRSSFVMSQVIVKKNYIASEAEIELVSVNHLGKPIKIPSILKDKLI